MNSGDTPKAFPHFHTPHTRRRLRDPDGQPKDMKKSSASENPAIETGSSIIRRGKNIGPSDTPVVP